MEYISIILPFLIALIVMGIKLYRAKTPAELLEIIKQDSPEIVDKAQIILLQVKNKNDKQLQ